MSDGGWTNIPTEDEVLTRMMVEDALGEASGVPPSRRDPDQDQRRKQIAEDALTLLRAVQCVILEYDRTNTSPHALLEQIRDIVQGPEHARVIAASAEADGWRRTGVGPQ